MRYLLLFLLACHSAPAIPTTVTPPAAVTVGTLTKIHDFSLADGCHPRAGLASGPDGNLYGTTWVGGTGGGTVYSIDLTGKFTLLYAFSKLDATGRNPEGYGPVAPVAFHGLRLYVVSRQGGTGGNPIRPGMGAITSMFLDGSNVKVEHDFGTPTLNVGYADGGSPSGGLVTDDGGWTWYGVSNAGIYQFDGWRATVAHGFNPLRADRTNDGGSTPYGTPVFAPNGALYGATMYGGQFGAGVAFKFDPATMRYQTLMDFPHYTFLGNMDNAPLQSLAVAPRDGSVVGTMEFGGVNGTGFDFRISHDQVTITHQHGIWSTAPPRFSSTDGLLPISTPVEAPDGWIYNTTFYGGANGVGAIVRSHPDGTDYTLLYSWTGSAHDPASTGAYPATGLTLGVDGLLYGTTFLGGASGCGTIYRLVVK